MATNKLLPFANGVGANVVDFATWSGETTILSGGFVTGIAKSNYVNRLLSQGALASYALGQLVVDQTSQDADLNENTFYTNFKNALKAYMAANAVALNGAHTVGGVKTFTSSPVIPTPSASDNSTKAASTAFVQGEIASQTVKLTGNQTVSGDKNFTGALQHNGYGVDSVVASGTGYIRYESGLQICFGETAEVSVTPTAAGQIYALEALVNLSYPMPFVSRPAVTVNLVTGAACAVEYIGGASATGFDSVTGIRPTGGTNTVKFYYIAIGTWK